MLILGLPASGKTTLARSLSKALQIPHLETDTLYWAESEGEGKIEDFVENVQAWISTHESWICEGHFKTLNETVSPLATVVLWLDLPWLLILMRALKRSIRTFDFEDLKFVLLWRRKLFSMQARAFSEFRKQGVITYHFTSPNELQSWLERVKTDEELHCPS